MKKIHENDSEIFLLKEANPLLVNQVQKAYNLTRLTAKIIANKGFETLDEISHYLSPTLKNLPNPYLFKEMGTVVDRIYRAIVNNESVMIYGDYDTDGITSTALLINFFTYTGISVGFCIPNRFQDGYGLNPTRLQQIHTSSPFTLLITVDCGSTNEEAIKTLRQLGVDTIVTDHHQAAERPPSAVGILNPAIPGCHFPFHALSGVGVAFFLLIALRHHLRHRSFWKERNIQEPDLRDLLDLVATGTIADMVPIRSVNRILVRVGLTLLSKSRNLGLATFLKNMGLYGRASLTPWEVAFQIAPRFNAAGRMADATSCVSLLTTQDPAEALKISKGLEFLNSQRQQTERELLKRIDQEIAKGHGCITPHAVVLWGDGWHEGVIGIGASKLVERFGRPVALISFNQDKGKGSLRGIPETDIFKALNRCRSCLESFGGHPMAGGLKIRRENLKEFCQCFPEAIKEQLNGILPKKRWEIDALIENESIPLKFFQELSRLEPFGIGNPPPLLAMQGYRILRKRLLKERHIRVDLVTDMDTHRPPLQGIAFNAIDQWHRVDETAGIIGVPTLNLWNGTQTPQIVIKRFL